MASCKPWVELTNCSGMKVRLVDVGAAISSVQLPLPSGEVRELVLGSDERSYYLDNPAFLGTNVGRFANRINKGQFQLGSESYQLPINQGPNHLHGGGHISHAVWTLLQADESSATYQIESGDGEQGYPGNLLAQVRYQLDDDNGLTVEFIVTVDKACPVNFTNHSYFNLDGPEQTIHQHQLAINASNYLPVSADGIPEGGLVAAGNTDFDFSSLRAIDEQLLDSEQQQLVSGYDHSFLLDGTGIDDWAAKLISSDKQVELEVFTDKPALHLYTGNFLQGTTLRDEVIAANYQGVALETQFLPDAPNRPDWPHQSCILQPGQEYRFSTYFRFQAR